MPERDLAGRLALRLGVHPVGGLGITGEPVAAVTWITNPTDRRVLLGGPPTSPFMRLTVQTADGTVLTSAPPADHDRATDLERSVEIQPGGTHGPIVQLIDYDFAEPGAYVIGGALGATVTGPAAESPEPPPAATVPYEVREAAAGEYEWLASYLAWWIARRGKRRTQDEVKWSPLWEVPGAQREARNLAPEMLSRLGRDEALPHLWQFAIVNRARWCFEGIRRLGTPAAREALERLAASRNTKASDLAQSELGKWDAEAAQEQ
jgi:hypothetical protein